jgi:hypothetical protein
MENKCSGTENYPHQTEIRKLSDCKCYNSIVDDFFPYFINPLFTYSGFLIVPHIDVSLRYSTQEILIK